MASNVDVNLRVLGDSKGAVRAFDDTTAAAKRTDQALGNIQDKISEGRRQAASTGAVFGGSASGRGNGGLFGQFGGSLQSVLSEMGLGGLANIAGIAAGSGPVGLIAAAVLGLKQGLQAFIPGPDQFDPKAATSPAETLQNLRGQRGIKGSDIFQALWGIPRPSRGAITTEIQKKEHQREIDAMQASSTGELTAAETGMTPWELAAARDILQHRAGRAAYEQQTNVTVNTVTAHLNDGESLRALVQRANRNNGITTTFTKP